MSLGTAHISREAGDIARIHQGRVGRCDFSRNDDGTLGGHLEFWQVRFCKAAYDAGADVADILHTRGHIGILKFRKTPEDFRYLSLYRSFRIPAVLSNPSFDAPY